MSKEGCLFCRIVRGEIQSTRVFEDETVLVIRDINPQSPVHVLVMPKDHFPTLGDAVEAGDASGRLFALLRTATKIAADLGVRKNGYRVVVNTGTEGGQTVDHLHLHLLGGRQMVWPPG